MRRSLPIAACLLLVAGYVALGGIGAGSSQTDDWRHRLVVANSEADSTEITVSVETAGGRVVTDTRRLAPGQRWIVTTLTAAEHGTGAYTVSVSTARRGTRIRDTFDTTGWDGPSARLYRVGAGTIATCGDSVSCYDPGGDRPQRIDRRPAVASL